VDLGIVPFDMPVYRNAMVLGNIDWNSAYGDQKKVYISYGES